MKKPASPVQTEKSAKRTPEEKAARKSAKKSTRVTTDFSDDRASKKASQKKTLKSAAKQLQKELNNRMNEVVARIRKETKAKLKEVVKEATRRLDVDTERMFEEALHTIVRHYDTTTNTALATGKASDAPANNGKSIQGHQKSQTLNKDGSPRKPRNSKDDATAESTGATLATKGPAKAKPAATGAKRGPKPATVAKPVTGAKRGPKPRVQVATLAEADGAANSASGPGTGEVSA
jgi:hypothetical protein